MSTVTPFIERQNNPRVLSGIATIDAGETATLPIPCGGRGVVRLGFPTMTGTAATFTVQAFPPADPSAPTLDPPFRPLYKNDGSAAVSVTVVDDSTLEVPGLSGAYAFTIVSGSAEASAREIEVQCIGEPAPFDSSGGGVQPADFAAPALTLGTTNTAGNSGKVLATNSTILAFDATAASTLANPNTAAAGSQAVAARRDHAHGVPSPGTVSTITSGASPSNGAGTGFATDTHIHGAPTLANAPTLNYKSSTQVFSANNTYADVTGAGAATFAFTAGANEVWEAEYWIPLAFTSTGGVKFQITGPASPSNVDITGWVTWNAPTTPVVTAAVAFTAVTAFSSNIAAGAAENSITTGGSYNSTVPTLVYIKLRLRNGANAGAVTLQAAQLTAAGTTTLGLSTYMSAVKVA